ncbi:MAG: DUF2254 domain-containing protein, partial [Hyphomicrobiaceae bacterium]
LRTLRSETEGVFVPHLAITISLVLALVCVGALIWFVGHIAGRINVETVTDLVSQDLIRTIDRLTTADRQPRAPHPDFWSDATTLTSKSQGYLLYIDEGWLADWAAEHETSIRLLLRPGNFVFPGTPIAVIKPPRDGAGNAIEHATATGAHRSSSADIEFAIRQLVEVALRALSPGINDPHTAIGAIDQLGVALCRMVNLNLDTGVHIRDAEPVLVIPLTDYQGLVDTMFHSIRQNGADQPSVLIRMLEVFTKVAYCETEPERLLQLQRHARLVTGTAEQSGMAQSDLEDVEKRYQAFEAALLHRPDQSVIPAEA